MDDLPLNRLPHIDGLTQCLVGAVVVILARAGARHRLQLNNSDHPIGHHHDDVPTLVAAEVTSDRAPFHVDQPSRYAGVQRTRSPRVRAERRGGAHPSPQPGCRCSRLPCSQTRRPASAEPPSSRPRQPAPNRCSPEAVKAYGSSGRPQYLRASRQSGGLDNCRESSIEDPSVQSALISTRAIGIRPPIAELSTGKSGSEGWFDLSFVCRAGEI